MFSDFSEEIFTAPDGISIHYGKNFKSFNQERTTLIFNYGLVCNIAHWKEQIPYFHQQGFQIIYHDYRFHFNNDKIDDIKDLSFKNIALDMNHLLSHLGVKKAFHLGHSMGVNTTLEFAFRFPQQVKGIILISGTVLPPQDILFNTNIMGLVQPILEILFKKYPNLSKNIWENNYKNPLATHLVHRGGFNTEMVSKDFVEHYLKKIGELEPEVFFQLLKEMQKHDIITKLKFIKTPALIMGGDRDQVIPNFLQNLLSENLPNAKLYIIKNGSHVPQVDFARTVNERIDLFLSTA